MKTRDLTKPPFSGSTPDGAVGEAAGPGRGRTPARHARFIACSAGLVVAVGIAAAQQPPPAKDAPSAAKSTATKEAKKNEEGSSTGAKKFADTIVVTATRSERELEKLPVSATVVGRDAIERSASFNIEDTLRDVTGLVLPNGSAANQYPTRNRIALRGVGEGRTLVLLDGVPILDPQFGHVNWNRISPESIDRIEVVRGASASLFGSSAMGGTVSLISRPVMDREVDAEVSYGTFDTRRASLGFGREIARGVRVGLNLDAGDSDGYIRIPDELRRPVDTASDWKGRNARLRAEIDLAPGVTGFVRGGYHTYDLSFGTELSGSTRETTDVSAGVRAGSLDGGALDVNLFYLDDQFDVQNVGINSTGTDLWISGTFDSPSELAGGSISWSKSFGDALPLLMVGADGRHMKASTYRRNFNAAGDQTSTQDSGGTQDSVGLFVQASWEPLDRLEVLVSLRGDSWRNSEGRDLRSSGSDNYYDAKSVNEVSPRVAARYELGNGLALRGAYYEGFGAPTLSQLYRSSAYRGQEQLGNPLLKPETLRGGEVGLDFLVPRVRIQLNAFTNTIDGAISLVVLRTEPLLTSQYLNVGEARSRGLELMSETFIGDRWMMTAGYSYTEATVRGADDPDLVGKQVPETPRNAASVGLVYRVPGGATLSARGMYVDRKYADAANLLAYDSHTLVDLFGSLPVGHNLEAFVGVTNLFDEEYLDDRTPTIRRGAPRQVHGGLRFRFTPSQSGRP